MKKIISVLLLVTVCFTFFACGHKDGDLGKQTTVNEENGYTLVQEVRPFEFSEEEDTLKGMKTLRVDNFKVTPENTEGKIKTKSDAIEIAIKEATSEYNTINLFHDRTRGIWKIVFSQVTETEAEDGSIKRDSVTKETVYVDEDGYTLLSFTE